MIEAIISRYLDTMRIVEKHDRDTVPMCLPSQDIEHLTMIAYWLHGQAPAFRPAPLANGRTLFLEARNTVPTGWTEAKANISLQTNPMRIRSPAVRTVELNKTSQDGLDRPYRQESELLH